MPRMGMHAPARHDTKHQPSLATHSTVGNKGEHTSTTPLLHGTARLPQSYSFEHWWKDSIFYILPLSVCFGGPAVGHGVIIPFFMPSSLLLQRLLPCVLFRLVRLLIQVRSTHLRFTVSSFSPQDKTQGARLAAPLVL